jgi:hypothetical protein
MHPPLASRWAVSRESLGSRESLDSRESLGSQPRVAGQSVASRWAVRRESLGSPSRALGVLVGRESMSAVGTTPSGRVMLTAVSTQSVVQCVVGRVMRATSCRSVGRVLRATRVVGRATRCPSVWMQSVVSCVVGRAGRCPVRESMTVCVSRWWVSASCDALSGCESMTVRVSRWLVVCDNDLEMRGGVRDGEVGSG